MARFLWAVFGGAFYGVIFMEAGDGGIFMAAVLEVAFGGADGGLMKGITVGK